MIIVKSKEHRLELYQRILSLKKRGLSTAAIGRSLTKDGWRTAQGNPYTRKGTVGNALLSGREEFGEIEAGDLPKKEKREATPRVSEELTTVKAIEIANAFIQISGLTSVSEDLKQKLYLAALK